MQKEINWLLKEKYHGKSTVKFKKDVKRLEAGEPLDYVIGFTNFLGCNIDLSKKPLIPRPETEYWVQKAIEQMNNPSTRSARSGQNLRILDIFAGSGCIGIAILKHIKDAKVVFVEKDLPAQAGKNLLEQIKINCRLSNIPKNRYKILQSDIFSSVTGKFDYIFANPPYIPTAKKSSIQKSVLQYEPSGALFGGADGLVYIRKFLAQAKNFLNPRGKIYMEFDSLQKSEILALIKKYGYIKWKFNKDQHGVWRSVVIDT